GRIEQPEQLPQRVVTGRRRCRVGGSWHVSVFRYIGTELNASGPAVHTLAPSRAAARFSIVAIASALLAACGGGTGPSEPTQLVFKAGANQDGAAGAALPVQIIVEARSGSGTVANVTIHMSVESSGGGSVAPASAKTTAAGQATFTWTLGPKLGTQTL